MSLALKACTRSGTDCSDEEDWKDQYGCLYQLTNLKMKREEETTMCGAVLSSRSLKTASVYHQLDLKLQLESCSQGCSFHNVAKVLPAFTGRQLNYVGMFRVRLPEDFVHFHERD